MEAPPVHVRIKVQMHFSTRCVSRSVEGSVIVRLVWAMVLMLAATLALPSVWAQELLSTSEPAADRMIPLVKAGKFEEASAVLAKAHAAYERDRKTEAEFHSLAAEFYRADPGLEQPLDAWVAQRAKDPFAYFARGVYRVRMGWVRRGGDLASQTSPDRFAAMAEWFSRAKGDFGVAIAKMPRLVEAYCYLILIEQGVGGHKKRSLYEQALKINPDSFSARDAFLNSLLPRWGGSYIEMQQVIAAARSSYRRMPRLKVLEGRVDADIGELLLYEGKSDEAKTYFLRALSKGDYASTNLRYGQLLYDMRDDAGALAQFNKVIRAIPGYPEGWRDRARVYRMQMRFPEAMADINRALEIEPQDDNLLATRGLIQMTAGNLDLALKDYETASAIDPGEPDYQKRIADIKREIERKKNAGRSQR